MDGGVDESNEQWSAIIDVEYVIRSCIVRKYLKLNGEFGCYTRRIRCSDGHFSSQRRAVTLR
jgi:hypothetical protein